jgi:hypothetical protein
MLALFCSLAFATETIPGTAVSGVTASQVESSTTPVKVASFVYQKITWDLKCNGPESALKCVATSNAVGKTATVVGGSGKTFKVDIGGAEYAVAVDGPLGISIDHILGIKGIKSSGD